MTKTFTILVIISGFTVWNSIALGLVKNMHVAIEFPMIGKIGIWTIIALYLGAVVDVSLGSRIFRFIQRRKKVRK